MNALLKKPHWISWSALALLLLLGIAFREHTLAIQLYDTYYVIAALYLALAGALLLGLLGAGYWWLDRQGKPLNDGLTALHLLPTLGILTVYTLPVLPDSPGAIIWLVGSMSVLAGSQLFYTLNVVLALLKK